MKNLLILLTILIPFTLLADDKSRVSEEKLRADGDWKEAYELNVKLLNEVSDKWSGQDLEDAYECIRNLRDYSLIEALLEIIDQKHSENGIALMNAGNLMLVAPHYGGVLDGEFLRGSNERGGYEYVSSSDRDRVLAINYYLKSLTLISDEKLKLDTLSKLGIALINRRSLSFKTELDKLPDLHKGYEFRSRSVGGAPVDAEGNPVYYQIPESFELAANDGERWRWTLAARARLSKAAENRAEMEFAQWLERIYSVATLQSFGYSVKSSDKLNGMMQLHTLSDEETVCRLATGVKRFELPDEQNYIKMYHELYGRGYFAAGDSLVRIYLNRRQYLKAKAILEELIKKQPNDSRLNLFDQITGNWGKFDSSDKTFAKGSEPVLGMVFRNAKAVKVSAFAVDISGIYKARRKYIKNVSGDYDWNKVNLYNLAGQLLNGDKAKFIGDKVAERDYELEPHKNHWDIRKEIAVPVTKAGAYLIKAEMEGSDPFYTLVWLEDIVVVSKSNEKGTALYVADSITGAPIVGADVEVFGYKRDRLKAVLLPNDKSESKTKYTVLTELDNYTSDQNGFVQIPKTKAGYQWSYSVKSEGSELWSNLDRNRWNNIYTNSHNQVKAFGMTSQPVYRPGSKVLGKFWVRRSAYDLGDISEFAGKPFKIEVHDPKQQKFGEDITGVVDEFGGIPFELDIDEGATLGSYRVSVRVEGSYYGLQSFRIEQYKKPEYEVVVEAPKNGVVLGDSFEAIVKANYYHGAPVTNAKVKVKVTRSDYSAIWFPYGKWDWLYGAGYGWLDIERPWYPGWRFWGCRCPIPLWWGHRGAQPELVFERELEIGADGTVSIPIDTQLAKMMHGDSDHQYDISAEVVDASRRTIFGSGTVLAAREPYRVTVWMDRGYAEVGQKVSVHITARTLQGKVVQASGDGELYRITYDKKGEPTEKLVQKWQLEDHPEGVVNVDLEASQAGQYRFVAKMKDEQGREVEGAVLLTVRGEGQVAGDFRYNDLELILDKRTYAPGETAKLLINTARENSSVIISVRGGGQRLIRVDGKSELVEIPVTVADTPNFFVEAYTVSDADVHYSVKELIVPPEKRVLDIAVLPSSDKYKPGDQGKVKVRVTGIDGEPVQGDVVLAVYDKALDYISGGSNSSDIKEFFWKWRRSYSLYGKDSLHRGYRSMYKKEAKVMQSLGVFDQILARLGDDVFGGSDVVTFFGEENDVFKSDMSSRRARKEGVALAAASAPAPGQDTSKPSNEVTIRKDFQDNIKWQGSLRLDEDGVGVIDVDYPDNLTTWKIKAWAMAHGTRVGEGEAEVITSKDLIVRLQAPRFFVEKDEVVLSAVVHNYHQQAKDVRVLLELEGGTLSSTEALEQKVSLAAKNGEQRVNWRVNVKDFGEATVRMKVIADNDSDAMEMKFPVYEHGIEKQEAWSRVIEPGQNEVNIEIEVPEERRPEDSWLEVRYSPSIAGAMVDALPYLVEYPYGCTEQTLNRFVPTVITQKLLLDMGLDLESIKNKRVNLNPQELGDTKDRAKGWKTWKRNPVFDSKEVDKMVAQGVERLVNMQLSDGGWGWFSGYGEWTSPHTTAVVLHGLHIAKVNGASIPDDVIERGIDRLKRYEEKETERLRMWKKRDENTKQKASPADALTRLVLSEAGVKSEEMTGFLFRDKNDLSVYAKSLLGMSLHIDDDADRRDQVIRNIEQFLVYDDENQTAYFELNNRNRYWWYWYGSEFELHAWYLKLKSATEPTSKEARGIAKYLLNNRKNATYWNSTRDTAYCIEALADFMKASGESEPDCEVEVLYDGKVVKTVKINKENWFSYDSKMTMGGDALSSGKHTITLRRKGEGSLYVNAYLRVFTKEDFIEKAGLEVKVQRKFYKIVRTDTSEKVAGSHGQVVDQKKDSEKRIELQSGAEIKSGDTIEVELTIDSKNDYEYLLFEDWKAAGMEAESVRSGYTQNGLRAYMEVKDEKVCFFVQNLPRGKHNVKYRLRAEIPGKFSALPVRGTAMYAPELRSNSDEMKVTIEDE